MSHVICPMCSKHAAIKVVASYTEDQLITSDPRQLLEIEEAKKEFAASLEEKDEINDNKEDNEDQVEELNI